MSSNSIRNLFRAGVLSLCFCLIASAVHAESRTEKVDQQLAAGEFISAIETAKSSQDATERSALLQKVATAQGEASDFAAAQATASRITVAAQRQQTRSNNSARRSLSGGGVDFESLMELIRREVGPEGTWEDVDGGPNSLAEFYQGVYVAPNGLLSRLTKKEHSQRLKNLGAKSRQANLNRDMAKTSRLRMVSLTRLEKEIARQTEAGQPVVESMKNLAGLSKIQYLFLYPETGDIVIAGPAEGWKYNTQGTAVGTDSGQPLLQLDDFVTVLRTFSKEGEGRFGCSINTRAQNVRVLKTYLKKSLARGPIARSQTKKWVRNLETALGVQDVVYYGIPEDSRVARVIVEADYRMKLIGIGKLNGSSKIPNYFDLMTVAQQKDKKSVDALRWWLSMKYNKILTSKNGNAFELKGSSVLCQSENQFINDHGQNVPTGKSDETNQLFAAKFTQNYSDLAKQDTVFADLQNVFDLAMVAAIINKNNVIEKMEWDMGSFASNGEYRTTRYAAPKVVPSAANHRVFRGKDIVVQIAGGVTANMKSILKDKKVVNTAPRLNNVAADSQAPQLPEGRWWWDVKN